MNESVLRWKGRIGGMKRVAGLVLVFALSLLAVVLANLSVAMRNQDGPMEVEIGQLVGGEIGNNRYVTVSGIALYPAVYYRTEDGRTTAEYFFLADARSGDMVLVQSSRRVPSEERAELAIITGLTRSTSTDLRELVASDLPDLRSAGLNTTSDLYIGMDQRPPGVGVNLALAAGLALISLASVAAFFFPNAVFAPKPIDPAAVAASLGKADVRATGRFQRLSNVSPIVEVGKGSRKFKNAAANIVSLEGRRLMVYIHHILTVRVYGIPLRRVESDWGVILEPLNVTAVETGVLYGWRDRPAVRLRHKDAQGKLQTLFVSFDHAAAQEEFVNLLKGKGFPIGSGYAAL